MIKRLVLPILVVIATYASLIVLMGASAWVHVDLPSLIIVPVIPLLYMGFLYGIPGLWAAFKAPGSSLATMQELRSSAAFFKDLGKAFWLFGLFGSAIGLVEVLRNLTDRTKLGPNLAIAIRTVLYAATFNLVLVLPFLSTAQRRLADMDAGNQA
jgi:flagellar motor component MotA